MSRRWPRSVWPFLIAAALAASTCGHRVVEFLAANGLMGGTYADYDHMAVAPVGLLAFVAALGGVIYSITRARRGGDASGVAIAGRALLRADVLPTVAIVFAIQLAALCAGENVEHFVAFRAPIEGLEWLGGPVLVTLAVHGLLGLCATLVLRCWLSTVLETCDALLRAVSVLVLALTAPWRACAQFVGRGRPEFLRLSGSVLAASNGLRAPPFTS